MDVCQRGSPPCQPVGLRPFRSASVVALALDAITSEQDMDRPPVMPIDGFVTLGEVLARRDGLCDWNPKEDVPTALFRRGACQNRATLRVTPLDLCRSCAALPQFKDLSSRPLRSLAGTAGRRSTEFRVGDQK